MYAKIFLQIYDGSLVEDWKVLVTFQQLLILADAVGVVDMTPEAIARRTNIPLEIITHGINHLLNPDAKSRSTNEEGRRIAPLDERSWGWRIVNHNYYKHLISIEDKREKDRQRIAEKRNKIKDVADSRKVSQGVADVAHTDVDVDTYTNINTKELGTSKKSTRPTSPQNLTDEDFIKALKNNMAYKGINIDDELSRMDAWFLTPQGRRRKKTRRFVVNWLNRIDKPMQGGGHGASRGTQAWRERQNNSRFANVGKIPAEPAGNSNSDTTGEIPRRSPPDADT